MIDKIKDSIMGQSLIEELQSIEGKLREQYKLAKENGEYLSTLQEYLHVSNLYVCLCVCSLQNTIIYQNKKAINLNKIEPLLLNDLLKFVSFNGEAQLLQISSKLLSIIFAIVNLTQN